MTNLMQFQGFRVRTTDYAVTSVPYNNWSHTSFKQKKANIFTKHLDYTNDFDCESDENEFSSFDASLSIFMKTQYVDEHNLGGVMI